MASKAGTAAFEHLMNVGFDVMSVVLDTVTNAIVAQIGDSTNENVDHDSAEWWQQTGFASMPAPPTQGGASCQGLAVKHSDRDMVFATRDLRASKIYGNLKPGEACMYATVGAARVFTKANGSVVLYTTVDNTQKGQSLSLVLAPTGVTLVTPWGGFMLNSSGWSITGPNGQSGLMLNASGDAKLVGTTASVSGSVAAIAGQIMTMIGTNATIASAAAVVPPNPTPGPLVGIGSATVFISP